MLFAVWCAQFKERENTLGVVLLSVKLQAGACNFTESNTPPWVFFTFFKLYKWCQTAQSITYIIQYTCGKNTFKTDMVIFEVYYGYI